MQITNHNFAIITPNNYYEILFPEQASIEAHGSTIIIKYGNIIHTFKPIEYGYPIFKPRKRVIKWNITLQKPSDLPKLSFSLSLMTKIKPLLLANNSLLHLPADNITFGRIIAYDSKGNQFNFTYKLTDLSLILIPPLNITKAIFPLIIDPTITFGSEYVFRSAETTWTSVDALTSNKFVVAYGNDSFQAVRIGEVSGTTITWGPEYTFSANDDVIRVTALDSTHIVVARRDTSGHGVAVVGTVSGNTISFGSETTFHGGTMPTSPYDFDIDALDSSHVVIAFQDQSAWPSYKGKAVIGTVSGTSISFGSEYTFNDGSIYYISVSSLTSSKFVVVYRDCGNNNYGTAIIGTVSGTTITFDSEYVFNTGTTIYTSVTKLTYDKFVVAYRDYDNSNNGTAVVGEVSGSTITFGNEYVFNPAYTESISVSALTSEKFVIAYKDGGNNYYGTAITGTVTGNTLSFDDEYVFNLGISSYISTSTLTSEKFVITYEDNSNNNYGTAIIGITNQPPTISNPQPANNSANVPITLSQLSVEISDPDGDLMDWTIETSPNIGSASGNNAEDGTITCPVSNLTYGTTYKWYVNVTDGNDWTNKTYTFTTETPDPPSNLKATSINTTTISLSWTKSPDTNTTVVVRKTGSYPTSVTDGVIVYNGTAESFTDTGLNPGTAYYYRAWSWAANAFSQSYTSTVNYTYPACPSNLQVIDFTDASITLSWNKGDGADRTLIYRNAQFIANTTDTTYTDDGLDPVTEYSYELYAYDSESGYRSLTSVQIYQYTRPEKPKNFGVSPVNETAIRLIWTKGEGADKTIVVRKSGDFPSSIDDGIVIYNGTGTIYNDVGLTPGTIYYYRAWSWSASLSYLSSDYAQDYTSTYPQPPSDVSVSLSPSGTTATLTISWSKGVGAQKTVIVKNQDHFPINKDDGIIVYNGTGTSYSETISQTYYYTLFSYANGLFSSGIKANWSAIWLNCYDEKTGQAIGNWSVFISDYLGTQVYSAENLTNSHIINVSQCPTGEKISFLFSAPNYSERVYYISVNSSTITTINAYLPQSNESQLYLIQIVGPQSEFSSPNIDNANIVIKKYIDTTESYETVTSVYTDANGQADVYLIPNTLYKVIISKQGYRTEIVDFIPSSEIYTKTFRILPEAEELTEYVQFWNVITFNATMLSNNTIRIVYVDSNQSTIDVDLYTYELYNSQYTLVDSFTTTDNIFTHYVEGINTSRTYLVKLYFNNTANFDISPPVTITVFPLTGIPEAPNKYDINNLIEPVIGPAPGGSWAPILAIILPLIILASFGPYNTTIGIVGSGLSLLFIQAIYARWFINSFNPLLVALGPFIIAIGILYGMTKGRGEEKL
ncbi:MAG: hypothetical protein DRN18_01730 [Thermoplasmata archaeon]|nr:MAG: hypothetical protein DRN18_01730 [Thermoplasmata archaeon]